MQEGVKRVFRDVMAATLDLYGKTASAPVLRLWWASLEPYTIDEVRHGFTKYVRSPDNGILMRKKDGRRLTVIACATSHSTAQSNPPWIVERLSPVGVSMRNRGNQSVPMCYNLAHEKDELLLSRADA